MGLRYAEGERLLEFAEYSDLIITKTCFKKHPSTYPFGEASTQTGYMLLRKTLHKYVSNIKVIPDEEIISRHQLLPYDFRAGIAPDH